MTDGNSATLMGMKRRVILLSIVVGLVALMLTPLALRAYTALEYRDTIYRVDNVPVRPVAIVFGARVLANGRLSTMLRDRVATAADLYHAGKIERVLLTGAGETDDYNEPAAMREYLLRLGVPDEAILLDPLGLRTYDSCYRARHEYDIHSATLVTQNFHLDRAMLLCDSMGIDVVGVWADYHRPNGYLARSINYSRMREIPATMLAFVDLMRRADPRN